LPEPESGLVWDAAAILGVALLFIGIALISIAAALIALGLILLAVGIGGGWAAAEHEAAQPRQRARQQPAAAEPAQSDGRGLHVASGRERQNVLDFSEKKRG